LEFLESKYFKEFYIKDAGHQNNHSLFQDLMLVGIMLVNNFVVKMGLVFTLVQQSRLVGHLTTLDYLEL
jgi:hypothetical protein